jgi:hypothetical protein
MAPVGAPSLVPRNRAAFLDKLGPGPASEEVRVPSSQPESEEAIVSQFECYYAYSTNSDLQDTRAKQPMPKQTESEADRVQRYRKALEKQRMDLLTFQKYVFETTERMRKDLDSLLEEME